MNEFDEMLRKLNSSEYANSFTEQKDNPAWRTFQGFMNSQREILEFWIRDLEFESNQKLGSGRHLSWKITMGSGNMYTQTTLNRQLEWDDLQCR